jgi:hypothetical protein
VAAIECSHPDTQHIETTASIHEPSDGSNGPVARVATQRRSTQPSARD